MDIINPEDWELSIPDAPELSRDVTVLDPADPFDAVLIDMVRTNRAKRMDYTAPNSSPWQNFDRTEDQTGGERGGKGDAVETLIATKQTRIRSLIARGTNPQNESVADSKLDRAVYCIIAYARDRFPDGQVP